MEIKKWDELTEEQRKSIEKLYRSHIKKNIFIGAKSGITLFLANVVIVLLNGLYVQSHAFCFIGAAVNTIFIFSAMNKETRKEYDRIKEETKKILEA